jgi:hypothetical protein
MAQLETIGRRAMRGGNERRGSVGAVTRQLFAVVAVVLGVAILASSSVARADSTEAPPPPTAADRANEEKANCLKRLEPAEKAIETDYKYARAWTDSWTVMSSSLVVLNLTQAFMVGDYKRYEALTLATTSLLLQIQRPLALTSDDSLKQIRAAAVQDPCLALADASHVLKSNQVDGELHRGWPIYVINAAFNLMVGAVLALASQHFDFVGDSNLGLQTVAGIALSELYTFTYPTGSLKTSGTAVEVTF